MTSRLLEAFEQFLNDDGTPIADGQLRFLVAGSTGTTAFQDTFSDINLQNENPNPLPIQASGRIPAVWAPDLFYRIRYERTDGTLIKEADYVGSPETQGQFGAWNNETVYTIDKIVYYGGKFYRSNVGGNQDNQPDISSEWSELDLPEKYNSGVTYGQYKLVYDAGILYISAQPGNTGNAPVSSPNWWQKVSGIPLWGSTTTYAQYALVIDSAGVLQVSVQNGNLDHNPVGDSGAWWNPLSIQRGVTLTGGGAINRSLPNFVVDSGTYTMPAANSLPINSVVVVEKQDRYRTEQPLIQCAGADTMTNSTGVTDVSIRMDYGYKTTLSFKTDGVSNWSV